ncbi:hypothetical protein DID80_07955 [Candidatus Marinamargulisbacteria bacterium SCGC AAA071-K20]|nr:hypothetical protein DID80_07955 [Candidatus Marinamargulisbacteria bacterium SCGC AAA071-K20]
MKRLQLEQILKDLEKKMVFLVGPRQVGKTWLAKQIGTHYKNWIYLNYDNNQHRKIILNHEWVDDVDLIVFDEIHKMENWKNFIKGIFDTRLDHQHILVTGSARLDAFNQTGDSLAGRFFRHHLFPFSISECKANNVNKIVARLINRGGFPEPFLAESDVESERWRYQYINGLIREDILDFEFIHNLSKIKSLIELLKERVGSPISYASLARDLELHAATIKKYIMILESLFIVFLVRPFSRSIARTILKEPKIYFYDVGLITHDKGAQFENLVALHLLQKVTISTDYYGKDEQLHYLRTKDNKEVDFALVRDEKLTLLIECKYKKSEIAQQLYYFSNKYDVDGIQLVCEIKNEIQKGRIKVLDVNKYFN